MALRVDGDEVKNIIDTVLTADEVVPFINSASLIVDNVLVGQGYGDNTLAEIEKWLSAHLISIRDPRIKQEKIGDAQVTYQVGTGVIAKGLDATLYGQQAKLLDYKNLLSNLSKRVASLDTIDFLDSS